MNTPAVSMSLDSIMKASSSMKLPAQSVAEAVTTPCMVPSGRAMVKVTSSSPIKVTVMGASLKAGSVAMSTSTTASSPAPSALSSSKRTFC